MIGEAIIIGLCLFLGLFIWHIYLKHSDILVKRKDFWFVYHFIPRRVKMPDCKTSKYFNRFPDKDGTQWSSAVTLDDPWLRELAGNIEKKIGRKSDRYKAGYILKLTQYAYRYKRDIDTYGVSEKWAFPVCTAYLRVGDCEDGTLLGAGLSHLLGIETITIQKEGHALYGVKVKGFGMRYEYKGESYLICETTGILPMGISFSETRYLGGHELRMEPDYLEKHTYVESFNNYRR